MEFLDDQAGGPSSEEDIYSQATDVSPPQSPRLVRQDAVVGSPVRPVAPRRQEEKKDEEKKFDAHRCQHFLTYPQTDHVLTKELLMFEMKSKFPGSFEYCIIGEEDHQPTEDDQAGGVHLHAYLKLNKKVRIRDARFFDVSVAGRVFHPHIDAVKKGQKNEDGVICYCTKGRNVLSTYEVGGYPRDYCKRKADAMEFARDYQQPAAMKWPVMFDGVVNPITGVGEVGLRWSPDHRRRILWIWGLAGWGKTLLWNFLFHRHPASIYRRPKMGNPNYYYEAWNHQPVVIMDDCKQDGMCEEEFIDMTEWSIVERPVFGNPRYRQVMMRPREQVVFIVCANVPPPPVWMQHQRFVQRVTVVECFGDKNPRMEEMKRAVRGD